MGNTLKQMYDLERLTLLTFDNITIAFPQSHILTIENLDLMSSLLTTEKSSGTLTYNSKEIPVYTFNRNLTMQAQPAATNRFCIAVKHSLENECFAIMCDEVNQYQLEEAAATAMTAVPLIMYNSSSPIVGLSIKENTLILISTAELMRIYINSQDPSNKEAL